MPHIACEKCRMNLSFVCFYRSTSAFVYLALHVLVALWQNGCAPSLSKGFHVYSRKAGTSITSSSRGPYLSCWARA